MPLNYNPPCRQEVVYGDGGGVSTTQKIFIHYTKIIPSITTITTTTITTTTTTVINTTAFIIIIIIITIWCFFLYKAPMEIFFLLLIGQIRQK